MRTGNNLDRGPAWISRVRFSKISQIAYWNGRRPLWPRRRGDPPIDTPARHRDDDISHAHEQALAWVQLGDDPARFLLAGPDSGHLLELVVRSLPGPRELVIHSMKLRRSALTSGGSRRPLGRRARA